MKDQMNKKIIIASVIFVIFIALISKMFFINVLVDKENIKIL